MAYILTEEAGVTDISVIQVSQNKIVCFWLPDCVSKPEILTSKADIDLGIGDVKGIFPDKHFIFLLYRN